MATVIDIQLREDRVPMRITAIDDAAARLSRHLGTLNKRLQTTYDLLKQIQGLGTIPALEKLQSGFGTGGGRGGGYGTGGGGSRPGTVQALPIVNSAQQKAAEARMAMLDARLQGGVGSNSDLNERESLSRQLGRYSRNVTSQTPEAKQRAAFMRTRFASTVFGGLKALPLGRDLGAMASMIGGGGGALAAGAGGAIAGATAAIVEGLLSAAQAARDAGNRITELGGAASLASSMSIEGIAPGSLGASKRSLSGLEGSVMSRYGLSPITGLRGDMDYGKRQRTIASAMLNAGSDRERQVIAEVFPEFAPLGRYGKYASKGIKDRLIAGSPALPQSMIREQAQSDASGEINGQTAGYLMNRFFHGLGTPVRAITNAAANKGDPFFGMSPETWGSAAGSVGIGAAGYAIGGPFGAMVAQAIELVALMRGSSNDQKQIAKNTKATADGVVALANGTYGGAGNLGGPTELHIGPTSYKNGSMRTLGPRYIPNS